MGDDAAAAAPAAPAEYKQRIIGEEGAPGSVEDVDGTADVVIEADKKYVVTRAGASMIPAVAACLEAHDPDSGAPKDEEHLGQVTVIPLPVAKGDVAAHILEYCERHAAAAEDERPRVEKPLRGKIEDLCPGWAHDFVKANLVKDGDEKQHDKCFEVMMGANALGVKPLEDLCGLAAASILKGKSPTQMRELFGLEGDFQPEEEEKILEDTQWTQS